MKETDKSLNSDKNDKMTSEATLEQLENSPENESEQCLQDHSQDENKELTPAEKELNSKIAELSDLNDKYLRLAAEFENFKRRTQRDQSETIRYANEKLLKDLLPTIDNLDRAIQYSKDQTNIDSLFQGVELTKKQFLVILEKLGVKQVDSIGELFDPSKHQAVNQVESSTVPENLIVDEYQKGYFLYDRILRPAMVTVSKGILDNQKTTSEGEYKAKEGEEV